jgi:molybdate transport system substrate-binding protein
MHLKRRQAMAVAAALLTIRTAQAASAELALMCDIALAAPITRAAEAYRAATGTRIQVFATAPGLIVPMLTRDTLIDIVISRLPTLAEADRAAVLKPDAPPNRWQTPLVVAQGAAQGAAKDDRFAVSELPDASGIDAQAALAALAIDPAKIVSAIDTRDVAFLLTTGAAGSGLLYLTDALAEPALRVTRTLTTPPPAVFGAAIVKGSGRPNQAGFVSFLGTAPQRAILDQMGLGSVA